MSCKINSTEKYSLFSYTIIKQATSLKSVFKSFILLCWELEGLKFLKLILDSVTKLCTLIINQ